MLFFICPDIGISEVVRVERASQVRGWGCSGWELKVPIC